MRANWRFVFTLATIGACPWFTPTAFAQEDPPDAEWDQPVFPVELHGFAEAATAARVLGDDAQPGDFLLGEVRFRLDLSHFSDRADVAAKVDLTADAISDEVDIDIRQARVTVRAADWLDIRVGRQVLTWGTGDFVFLNDLFPKDFISFFVGRDDEFLKAPSNAMKLTVYSDVLNLDVVWTPVFEPDRFITGERLSFFDPSAGERVSSTTLGQPLQDLRPDKTLENGEFAARGFRTIGGYELNAYGYWGFTKQPLALDLAAGLSTYSRLAVYGASVRGTVLGGIGNLEGAFYDSADDPGTDPTVPNSEIRALVGHERELAADLTLGLQYSLTWTQDHDALVANSAAPSFEPDEFRHTFTGRLTSRLSRQTLTLSLFAFVSPSEEDVHFRPSVAKQLDDAVTVIGGANIMAGKSPGFFGQLEDNTNVYLRIRYSF
jgi:hypothetical protein